MEEYLVCLWVGVNKTSWLGSEPSHYPEHLLTWLIWCVINSVMKLAKTEEWTQKHFSKSLEILQASIEWCCVRYESRCVLLTCPENWNSKNPNFACLVTRGRPRMTHCSRLQSAAQERIAPRKICDTSIRSVVWTFCFMLNNRAICNWSKTRLSRLPTKMWH